MPNRTRNFCVFFVKNSIQFDRTSNEPNEYMHSDDSQKKLFYHVPNP